ncbi:ABC transporter permease [Ahrensia marina]|uniref:ABC transporter permease n=1 Tax=Ahrensia marina TaxID=1514904 RepID=UPI0035CFF02B
MSLLNETQVDTGRSSSGLRKLSVLWEVPELRLLLAILIGVACLAMVSDAFLTGRNLRSVLLGFSFVGIAAIGQLLVIITGRIDLSGGSVMGLAGMVCALTMAAGMSMWVAMAAGVLAGAAIGLFNGVFSVRFGITSFIVTLGTLQIARGITVGLTEGDTVTGFPDLFLFLGSGRIVGVPIPVIILVVVAVSVAAFLRFTGAGRELYAIGGNESAARLAGVPVKRLQYLVFIASGTLAGLAGVLLTARLGAAVSNAAAGYELTIIASVVIGGASLAGGFGTAFGVVLGALLIAFVNNALVLLTVPTYWQQTFIGAVIVAAALLDRLRR